MKYNKHVEPKRLRNIETQNDLLKCPICHGYIHCSLYVDLCTFATLCSLCKVNSKNKCSCNVLRYVKEIESLRGAIYDKEW